MNTKMFHWYYIQPLSSAACQKPLDEELKLTALSMYEQHRKNLHVFLSICGLNRQWKQSSCACANAAFPFGILPRRCTTCVTMS